MHRTSQHPNSISNIWPDARSTKNDKTHHGSLTLVQLRRSRWRRETHSIEYQLRHLIGVRSPPDAQVWDSIREEELPRGLLDIRLLVQLQGPLSVLVLDVRHVAKLAVVFRFPRVVEVRTNKNESTGYPRPLHDISSMRHQHRLPRSEDPHPQEMHASASSCLNAPPAQRSIHGKSFSKACVRLGASRTLVSRPKRCAGGLEQTWYPCG